MANPLSRNEVLRSRLSDFLMVWYEDDGEYDSGSEKLAGIMEAEIDARIATFKAALFAIDHDVAQRVIASVDRAAGK